MKILYGLAIVLSMVMVRFSRARELSLLDLDMLYDLLSMVHERQAQEAVGAVEMRQKVASDVVETVDHFAPGNSVRYVNSSLLENITVDATLTKPKFQIGAGLYFDVIKNNDDDDCEGKWFWPFSAGNSTVSQPRLPTSSLVTYASNQSHGLFIGTREPPIVIAPANRTQNTSATAPSRPTLVPLRYIEAPVPYFVQMSSASTFVPSLLYAMIALLLCY